MIARAFCGSYWPRALFLSLAVQELSMATDAERDLFASRVLAAVGREAAGLPRSPLTGFLGMAGRSYDHGLMVVGRAVNGWTESILDEWGKLGTLVQIQLDIAEGRSNIELYAETSETRCSGDAASCDGAGDRKSKHIPYG